MARAGPATILLADEKLLAFTSALSRTRRSSSRAPEAASTRGDEGDAREGGLAATAGPVLPLLFKGAVPPGELLEQAVRAERAGFDSIASSDNLQPSCELGESGQAWQGRRPEAVLGTARADDAAGDAPQPADGEARNRTGDTTIFRQSRRRGRATRNRTAMRLWRRAAPWSYRGIRLDPRGFGTPRAASVQNTPSMIPAEPRTVRPPAPPYLKGGAPAPARTPGRRLTAAGGGRRARRSTALTPPTPPPHDGARAARAARRSAPIGARTSAGGCPLTPAAQTSRSRSRNRHGVTGEVRLDR